MTEHVQQPFAFLEPGDPFPPFGTVSEELGPLAIGGDLSVPTLLAAYRRGIFPWYSTPPILWWSTHPRMVLKVDAFVLHDSLRKTLIKWRKDQRLTIRINHAFPTVLRHCARMYRPGQSGTWIIPEMQAAYQAFHQAGHVHSVETWLDDELAGGLYFVSIGKAVFGESMFARKTDASKAALAALVAMCRRFAVPLIDCQQNTGHLASMGAAEITRSDFLTVLRETTAAPQPCWAMTEADWSLLDARLSLPAST